MWTLSTVWGEVIPPPYARNNIDKVKNNSIKYIKIDFYV